MRQGEIPLDIRLEEEFVPFEQADLCFYEKYFLEKLLLPGLKVRRVMGGSLILEYEARRLRVAIHAGGRYASNLGAILTRYDVRRRLQGKR